MSSFPRTTVGGISVSRMIIGTNWFLGYTHCTRGKTTSVERMVTNPKAIADIIEVFLRAGVDTIMCPHTKTCMFDAIDLAQQRVGKKLIIISTPSFTCTKRTAVDGFDLDEVQRILDDQRAKGVSICMPHTSTTDLMVDKCAREVRQMSTVCKLIRERGMIPGLSTHIPETIVYADETNLDVETYIQPFNLMGYLMHLEVDWTARIIQQARRPVMTIKGMAAGQLRPYQAMTFVWNAIRPVDMVTVGTMAPEEAAEIIDLSLGILSRSTFSLDLQETRSKASVIPAKV